MKLFRSVFETLSLSTPRAQVGHTALHAAAGCGHEEVCELLLAHKDIDYNPKDKVCLPIIWNNGIGSYFRGRQRC
jgi:ankyrin repeat protein